MRKEIREKTVKEIAKEIEKYDIIFVGNITDKAREKKLNRNEVQLLFKELNYLGVTIPKRDKTFIYSCL